MRRRNRPAVRRSGARPPPRTSATCRAGPARHRQSEREHDRSARRTRRSRPPGRVPVDRARRQVHAVPRVRRPGEVAEDASCDTNRPGSPRASSHAGPSSPSRNAALAPTSAARHDAPTDRHLRPRRSTRAAGARVDQVMLLDTAARPAAPGHCRSSRRRLPAPARRRRPAPRRSPARSRQIASCRDEAVPPMHARASSTASALTTPFRSSRTSRGRASSRPVSRTDCQRPGEERGSAAIRLARRDLAKSRS